MRLQLRIASFPDCFFDAEKICDRQYKHGNNAEKSHFKRFGKGTGGNSAQDQRQIPHNAGISSGKAAQVVSISQEQMRDKSAAIWR